MVRCIRLDFRLLINYEVINLMLRCIRQDYGFKSVQDKAKKKMLCWIWSFDKAPAFFLFFILFLG